MRQSFSRASARPSSAALKPKPILYLRHTSCDDEGDHREFIRAVVGCAIGAMFDGKNDKLPTDPLAITAFHSASTPLTRPSAYFARLTRYCGCSAEVMVEALMHINRVLFYRPDFVVNGLTVHRLLLASLLVGAKFKDDRYHNNAYYAKFGGVAKSELNMLEVQFLILVNFDLHVSPESYDSFLAELSHPVLHPQPCVCGMKTCGCCVCLPVRPQLAAHTPPPEPAETSSHTPSPYSAATSPAPPESCSQLEPTATGLSPMKRLSLLGSGEKESPGGTGGRRILKVQKRPDRLTLPSI